MIRNVLAIAAGKGGVGKSTVAVNLALALHNKGAKVGIIDADLYGPSIRHMLPEERLPSQEGNGKILPAMAQGIVYISIDFFRKNSEASLVRAPIANAAISQFLDSVEWGDLDYLLIDFPPGTGDIQLTLSQQANLCGAILITWPQDLSLIDVRKAAELFIKSRVPILGIIENMHGLFPGNAGEILAQETKAPLLLCLPFDLSINKSPRFELLADLISNNLIQEKTSYDVQFSLPDPSILRLEWEDGFIHEVSLAELQANCPCVRCREKEVQPEEQIVLADGVTSIGRYALSIQFRTGCNKGVYPFDMLRKWRVHA
jgi:ATP-binding protein involved in chromosome partitioning